MYVIKNARLGAVGTEYKPKPGINVNALLWAGFIIEQTDNADTGEVSTTPVKKGAKNKKATKED